MRAGGFSGARNRRRGALGIRGKVGIGISAGHIRAFLAKHHITPPPAESDTPTLSTEDIAECASRTKR